MSEDVRIRQAEERELKNIVKLSIEAEKEKVISDFEREEFKKLLESYRENKNLILVVMDSGKIVGYLYGRKSKEETNRVIIDTLYLRKEYRSRGIGRKLVNSFISLSKGKYEEVYTAAIGPDAKVFFERCGFTKIRVSQTEPCTVTVMALKLVGRL